MPSVLTNYFQHTLHKKLLVLEQVEPTTKLTAFCQARGWAALGQKVRYSAAGNAWRRCRHHFRIVDGKHVKSCYHLATTLHQAALDSSATMPPVGASFGQSRHLSQWRSSVTNSTPAIRPTHQVHQSTIEEGSQSNEVYSSSSNFSSDKPSGICDEGANASSLLIFFRNTPTGIPNPIYREPATCQ